MNDYQTQIDNYRASRTTARSWAICLDGAMIDRIAREDNRTFKAIKACT